MLETFDNLWVLDFEFREKDGEQPEPWCAVSHNLRTGENVRWSMAMVIIVTAASVVFNIAHATGGILTALTSATPPLLLFLSFESLMRQLRSQLGQESKSMENISRPGNTPKPVRQRAKVTSAARVDAETRDREIQRLLKDGCSKRAVARTLGVSPKTVRRLAI